ncbi:hypothetical protein N9M10_04875, partial [Hellea sp.]|nr:hypothetical protein [Hellea sp.]
ATDAGANVRFDFGGGNSLTVIGRNIADLDAGDFDFGGTAPAGQAPAAPAPAPASQSFADMVDILDMDALL